MSNLSLKQQLSQEQLAVVQSEMELKKKSMVVAYLFAFFLGIFGAHRFYVGKTGTAVAQLVLTLLGIITMFIYVGFLLIWIVGIWVFIDYFLLYGYVKRLNEDIERRSSRKSCAKARNLRLLRLRSFLDRKSCLGEPKKAEGIAPAENPFIF